MESVVISTILVNILVGSFAVLSLCWAFAGVQTILYEHKREKREAEKAQRDEEYHLKRMAELN